MFEQRPQLAVPEVLARGLICLQLLTGFQHGVLLHAFAAGQMPPQSLGVGARKRVTIRQKTWAGPGISSSPACAR